jgi:peptidyl-prolyl cis-trans isomerase D
MMARAPEPETPRKRGKAGQYAIYGLMAVLLAGLGGYGSNRLGSVGVAHIGTVGDRNLTTTDYARALKRQTDDLTRQFGQPANMEMLRTFGLDQQVLQGLINRAALDNEAARLGLSVGDEVIAQEIQGMQSFHAGAGGFNRDTYTNVLKQEGLTEATFEKGLREDMARSLLQGAINGGYAPPATMTETLYQWVGERRGYTLLTLTEADLTTPVPAPTDAELQAFYDANIDQFTKPEAKRIAYAALLPDTIAGDMVVDEAALRAEYDKRIDEFVQPEKRLVERLAFPDDATAAAAKARIDAGGTFEAEVDTRGVRLEDIDLGDVTPEELGAAGDAVFALTEPGVVGPFASDFGPSLFRMNGILAAQEMTFDEAREQLAGEAQLDAARREIATRGETINDALAGGATLAEMETEQGMTAGTLDYVVGGQNDDAIAGYEAFRAAADAVNADSFPEALPLDDGGIVALELKEIVPPAPIPFADAKADVTVAWRADALQKALSARAIEVKSAVEGGAAIGSFGIVSVTPEIAREGFAEGTPPAVVAAVFAMDRGQLRVMEDAGFVGVVQLDAIIPAAADGEEAQALRDAISAQTEQAIAQDVFTAYVNALSEADGVQLDEQAIAAVQAQFN